MCQVSCGASCSALGAKLCPSGDCSGDCRIPFGQATSDDKIQRRLSNAGIFNTRIISNIARIANAVQVTI